MEWEKVSEHAQSVLDENTSLLKQQDLYKEQMKEMKGQHQAIGNNCVIIVTCPPTLFNAAYQSSIKGGALVSKSVPPMVHVV